MQDVFGIVGTTEDGSFRVVEAVAEGGFAVVYRAEHIAFRAPVALKCLRAPEGLTPAEQASFFERFREEAELLFQLSAAMPDVVRPLHLGKLSLPDRFVPYLVLEWLDGQPLDEALGARRARGQAPMGAIKLVKLLAPVARVLSRAHRFPTPSGRLAIVHRDIKPENIFLVDRNGEKSCKLLDFGIATVMRLAGEQIGVRPDAMVGYAFTPGYGSPEQWEPARFGNAGPATDVWGLALTMAEALAGRRAIDGTLEEMRAATLDRDRRPTPRQLGVTVAAEVEGVFEKALRVDPRTRTQTIDAFWTGLEEALGLETTLRRDPRRESDTDAGRRSSLPPPTPSWLPPAPAVKPGLADTPAIAHGEARAPRPTPTPAPATPPPLEARPAPAAARAPSTRPVPAGIPGPTSPPRVFAAERAPSPLRAPPRSSASPPRRRPAPPRSTGSIGPTLYLPVAIILLALIACAADLALAAELGARLALGPVRLPHAAALLLLAGTGLFFWRVLGDPGPAASGSFDGG